jgi:hypothetical protein
MRQWSAASDLEDPESDGSGVGRRDQLLRECAPEIGDGLRDTLCGLIDHARSDYWRGGGRRVSAMEFQRYRLPSGA